MLPTSIIRFLSKASDEEKQEKEGVAFGFCSFGPMETSISTTSRCAQSTLDVPDSDCPSLFYSPFLP